MMGCVLASSYHPCKPQRAETPSAPERRTRLSVLEDGSAIQSVGASQTLPFLELFDCVSALLLKKLARCLHFWIVAAWKRGSDENKRAGRVSI